MTGRTPSAVIAPWQRRGVAEDGVRGQSGHAITREFKHDENGDLVVSHDYFKTYRTGGGIAKDVLRASFDEYEKLGVTKVTVATRTSTWAVCMGEVRVPADGQSRHRPADCAGRAGREDHARRARDAGGCADRERGAGPTLKLWDISDLKHPDTAHLRNGDPKIGAAVLIGSDWTGEIELSDKVAMARLRGYIAETKPEKPAPVKGTTADTERANQANVAAANRNAANRAKADWIAQESERRPTRPSRNWRKATERIVRPSWKRLIVGAQTRRLDGSRMSRRRMTKRIAKTTFGRRRTERARPRGSRASGMISEPSMRAMPTNVERWARRPKRIGRC